MSATELGRSDFDAEHRSDSTSCELLTPAQYLQRLLELPIVPLLGMLVLFFAAFSNLINLQVDKDSVALDQQVLFKLAVLAAGGIYGVIGILSESRVRKILLTFPVMWMVIILGFYFLAVPGSITPTESLASAVSIACILLMTVTALVQLGVCTVLNTVFHAIGAFVLLSWVAYFVAPEIGIFEEPLSDGQFAVRMSGLAHPNTLGQFSGVLIVLGIALGIKYKQVSLWRIGMILLAAGALVGSLSRTSLLATVVAIAVIYRDKWLHRRGMLVGICLLFLGIAGLMSLSLFVDVTALVESQLGSFTKSGDTDELTSVTGRVEIWAYAIRLIAEQPLTGYGAATTKYYLSDYSLYAHNMILNIAFSTGIFGGIAAVCMCAGRVVELFKRRHPVADALVVFILVNGLFENVMFSILAGMPTVVWTIALCLPGFEPDQDEQVDTLRGVSSDAGPGSSSDRRTK